MKQLIFAISTMVVLGGCTMSVGETLFPGDTVISNDNGQDNPGGDTGDNGGDNGARFVPNPALLDITIL